MEIKPNHFIGMMFQNSGNLLISYFAVYNLIVEFPLRTSLSLCLDLASYYFQAYSLLLEEKLIKKQKRKKLDIIGYEGLNSFLLFGFLLTIDYYIPCNFTNISIGDFY